MLHPLALGQVWWWTIVAVATPPRLGVAVKVTAGWHLQPVSRTMSKAAAASLRGRGTRPTVGIVSAARLVPMSESAPERTLPETRIDLRPPDYGAKPIGSFAR